MTCSVRGLCAAALIAMGTLWDCPTFGQVPPANYDEALIPKFTLPDPLVCADGTRVTSAEQWTARRAELLDLFATEMYGKLPACDLPVKVTRVSDGDIFDGKATRREVDLTVTKGDHQLTMTLLLYIPKSDKPVPAFVGLNFGGNHTVSDDPAITLNPNWMRPGKDERVVDNRATEASRGTAASRWPIDLAIERGYAVGTMYYGDIDPDFDDDFQNGIHPFCYGDGQTKPAADQWGSIAAWAWGLSRILDYLETEPQIDAKHVAVLGHSRLGKTSLWAGAADERFALVISNNSGCGGAALNKRVIGESVHRINTSFPHWFCDNFVKYNSNEAALTFDQHELIALMAPRPVYVASAVEDTWADPKGEYLSCVYADPVYRLLGTDGLGGDAPIVEPPAIDQPRASGRIGYHIRTGKHDITRYDWEQYLNFADRHFR
ncbi:MAG: acetylxylan esterase [Planctomycetaceae bacterium]|nr:acetylxylan esterase [Planctomycetaceae bacterium]